MMITFDGHGGSGKTTQAKKIAQLMEGPVVSILPMWKIFNEFHYAAVGTVPTDISCLLRDLAIIRAMQLGPRGWRQHKCVVLDDCCFKILYFFRKSHDFDLIFDLFCKGLALNSGREPIASFYLHVTRAQSALRAAYRTDNPTHSIKEVKLSGEGAHPRDAEDLAFWERLASEISYLHIIDGMQPEQDVTRDIVTRLRQEGVIDVN